MLKRSNPSPAGQAWRSARALSCTMARADFSHEPAPAVPRPIPRFSQPQRRQSCDPTAVGISQRTDPRFGSVAAAHVGLWRIIAVATAAEASAASALAGLLGVAGAWYGWLNMLNQFALIGFGCGCSGGAGAQALLPGGPAAMRHPGAGCLRHCGGLFLVAPQGVASMDAAFRSEHRPLR